MQEADQPVMTARLSATGPDGGARPPASDYSDEEGGYMSEDSVDPDDMTFEVWFASAGMKPPSSGCHFVHFKGCVLGG